MAGSVGIAGSSSHTPTRRPLSVLNAAGGSSSVHAPWRAGSGSGQHREQEVEVLGAAGHRSEHVEVGVGRAPADAVEVAALGDHAVARLEPERATAVRRDPHGTTDVGAELERREPGRDGCRRAAGRTAGDARHVPRVVRGAEDLVEALRVTGPARQVRLAEHDGARLAQAGHRRRVGCRHVVRQLDGAARGADAGRLDGVLDRDREAVQWRQRSATTRPRVGGVGLGACPVHGERDDGVDRGVEAVDAIEVQLEQVATGDLRVADRLRLLGGGLRGPGVVQHAAIVRGRPGAPGTWMRPHHRRGNRERPRAAGPPSVAHAHDRRKLWRRFWFTTRSAMRRPASVENR